MIYWIRKRTADDDEMRDLINTFHAEDCGVIAGQLVRSVFLSEKFDAIDCYPLSVILIHRIGTPIGKNKVESEIIQQVRVDRNDDATSRKLYQSSLYYCVHIGDNHTIFEANERTVRQTLQAGEKVRLVRCRGTVTQGVITVGDKVVARVTNWNPTTNA